MEPKLLFFTCAYVRGNKDQRFTSVDKDKEFGRCLGNYSTKGSSIRYFLVAFNRPTDME